MEGPAKHRTLGALRALLRVNAGNVETQFPRRGGFADDVGVEGRSANPAARRLPG